MSNSVDPPSGLTAGSACLRVTLAASSCSLRCWGNNLYGQLGFQTDDDAFGDEPGEMPPMDANLGGLAVLQVDAGPYHICAVLEDNSVRCWGRNNYGQLGYGNTTNIGWNDMPPPPVQLH